jgi:hypothetical protein
MLSDFSLAANLAILDGLAFLGNPFQDFTGSLERLGDGMEGNFEIRNFFTQIIPALLFSFADAFLLADFLPDRSNLHFFLADGLLQFTDLAQQALGLLAKCMLLSFQPLAQGSGLLLLLIQRTQL